MTYATAAQILGVRDGLQMGGVHACSDKAEVIDRQSSRDRANHEFVRDPMRTAVPAIYPESAVAVLKAARTPQPAGSKMGHAIWDGAGLVDLSPEALSDRYWLSAWGLRLALPKRSPCLNSSCRIAFIAIAHTSAALTAARASVCVLWREWVSVLTSRPSRHADNYTVAEFWKLA